jgi:hypothetical protein
MEAKGTTRHSQTVTQRFLQLGSPVTTELFLEEMNNKGMTYARHGSKPRLHSCFLNSLYHALVAVCSKIHRVQFTRLNHH